MLVTVSTLWRRCVLLTCWQIPEFSSKVLPRSRTLITRWQFSSKSTKVIQAFMLDTFSSQDRCVYCTIKFTNFKYALLLFHCSPPFAFEKLFYLFSTVTIETCRPSLENKNGFKKVWTLRTYFKKKCFVKGELCSRKTMSSYRRGTEENIGQEVKRELEVRWLIAVKLSFSSYKRLMWHCRWAEWKLKSGLADIIWHMGRQRNMF